jgi:hypothetical protein
MKNLGLSGSFASLCGLCSISLLAFIPSALADDWTQWRGPNRDGIPKETGWLSSWPADGPRKPHGQTGKLGLAEATPAAFRELCSL